MNGREKCELINSIRKKVADNNNIDFIIYDCSFVGDCSGSCQKSISELNYLEKELEKRQNEGMKLNLNEVFALDNDEVSKSTSSEEIVMKRQEKLEKLMENPELADLPSRYLDMLL